MINKKSIIILGIFLIGIFSLILISAAWVKSSPAYTQGPYFVPHTGPSEFGLFDRSMCEAGQDFILQIDPLGCTPSVVRSDLLEDQNVPILCPITGIQMNPLIKVEAIDYITIRGKYPPEVQGVTYYPARAALGKFGAQINTPMLNNMGYAVIILKRQPNESALLNCEDSKFFGLDVGEVCWVEGNLTATLRYDIQNAFGVGKATFYLPELLEDEWQNTFTQYGFWNGKGYIRAEGITDTSATISIYSDRETYGRGNLGEKRKISTVKLQIGQESQEIFMPGFDFCLGSMQVRLKGLENPDTRARLQINGDAFEVKDGERFLEDRCRVLDIEKQGIVHNVRLSCEGDEKTENFYLMVNPKVILNIDGTEKNYKVGDRLFDRGGDKSVYLAYVGTKRDSVAEKDLYIVAVSVPGTADKLTEDQINSIGKYLNQRSIKETGNLASLLKSAVKVYTSAAQSFLRYLIEGENLGSVSFGDGEETFGKHISIIGFAEAYNIEYGTPKIEEYYELAEEDYQTIQMSFSSEKYSEESVETLGEQALRAEILLAQSVGQNRRALELCIDFQDSYPGSVAPDLCSQTHKLSSSESSVRYIVINGQTKRISLDRIREPTFDEFGVVIMVENISSGAKKVIELRKNEIAYLGNDSEEFIQLVSLDEDYAKVRVSLKRKLISSIREFIIEPSEKNLRIGYPERFGSDNYLFTVQEINLKKLAKVSINPRVNYASTEAEFPFKIGIEKRAIQLTPEKTREKIDNLENTIETVTKISGYLNNVVKGFKFSCLGIGTYLTAKNFLNNLHGEGIARKKVMRGDFGWYEKCRLMVPSNYPSIEKCLLENSDAIDNAVEEYAEVMEEQNKNFKKLQGDSKGTNVFGDDIVDTEELMVKYVTEEYKTSLKSILEQAEIFTIPFGETEVSISDIINNIGPETIRLSQARELELNSELLNSDDEIVREIAQEQLTSTLTDIFITSQNAVEKQRSSDLMTRIGFSGIGVTIHESEDSVKGIYDGYKTPSAMGQIPAGVSATSLVIGAEVYILQLDRIDVTRYRVIEVYNSDKIKLSNTSVIYKDIQDRYSFELFDSTSYKNKYHNPEIRYYETAPYKGLPAIVPFDTKNGWYVYIKSIPPVGGQVQSYFDSGRVSSFYIGNVGKNGLEEFNSGSGDDIYSSFMYKGNQAPKFTGLSDSEALILKDRAERAIADASKEHGSGIRRVKIDGEWIEVGVPAVNLPDIQCEDFMSPSECNLLFNVCDPVICPSSRCDLGGTYAVKDVIQSGIIGSVALCLPNAPDIKVPVCLSGIAAGVDGFTSVLNSYQDCLQTSLDTGQTVGICDEIYSIHMCEFFWRQSLPMAKLAAPRLLGAVLGQNVRGGGEYLGVQNAFQTAENSVQFFTQYYAANSFKSFKFRSTETVGTAVCKNFVSLTSPTGGNLLDSLIAPDSPPQFYGRFEEIPFTTATNPPTSHYKVFYHIYAGKELPAYFKVYLKGTGSSFYQDISPIRMVANGFISAGEYASETRDFTGPTGYTELCIMVNGQEECGFGQATTSFGVNYLSDLYIQQQTENTDITTEKACISGTASVYSLLNPNLQEGIGDVISPELYNRGITRICSTDSPGKGTDEFWDTEDSRWKEVGYCDNTNLRCWLDRKTVVDTVTSTAIEEEILGEVTDDFLSGLREDGGYLSSEQFKDAAEEIEAETNLYERIDLINSLYTRVFLNKERAYLLLLRGNTYAQIISSLLIEHVPPSEEEGKYPILEYHDGSLRRNIYYIYSEDSWYWTKNKKDWFRVNTLEGLSDENAEFVGLLVDKNYLKGLQLLMARTVTEKKKLSTERVEYKSIRKNQDGRRFWSPATFRVSRQGEGYMAGSQRVVERSTEKVPYGIIHFNYDMGEKEWEWAPFGKDWISISVLIFGNHKPIEENLAMMESLEGLDYYEGAIAIFRIDAVDILVESLEVDVTTEAFPVFEYHDGGFNLRRNIRYTYSGGSWVWSKNEKEWFSVENLEGLSDKNAEFAALLRGKTSSEGLQLLMNRVVNEGKSLSTDEVDFSDGRVFTVDRKGVPIDLHFIYALDNWRWSTTEGNWVAVPETMFGGREAAEENILLIRNLENRDYLSGAKLIFGIYSGSLIESEEDPGTTGTSGEESEETGTTGEEGICWNREDCQRYLGEQIIPLAQDKKVQEGIQDSDVKADTGVESFECLALMVARTESGIQHCKEIQENGNPLYCNGEIDEIRKPVGLNENSNGIMQINLDVHADEIAAKSLDISYIGDNVLYGLDVLIDAYSPYSKPYACNDEPPYSGWKYALRGYNGWNTDCSKGNPNYVEVVLGDYNRGKVEEMFPEVC